MKAYAIKTTKGYLATQGDSYWFEDKPVGWALFSFYVDAIRTAENHHSAIGTKPHEGYTIEDVEA